MHLPQQQCQADHPPMQRRRNSWRCPMCGSKLMVDVRAARAHADCDLIHSDDQLCCANTKCQFAGYGNYVARLMATAGHNRLCRECRGRGWTGAAKCKPAERAPCTRCQGRGYTHQSSYARSDRQEQDEASSDKEDAQLLTPT
jgi:DNA-directed RNA polymerase subunit RPC12/RpoP